MDLYANNAAFGALVEFPCRSAADAVLARKIPLPTRSPNRIQAIDIHHIIDVGSGLFRGSDRFFPCRQGARTLRQSLREVPMISFVPQRWVMDLRALMGVGPRVTKHTIGDVRMSPFPSYEDIEVKG
jgi:hypothetical protein